MGVLVEEGEEVLAGQEQHTSSNNELHDCQLLIDSDKDKPRPGVLARNHIATVPVSCV